MPIFEYICSTCKHVFDKIQKFSDPPLSECPECHKHTLEKQISTGNIHFKGTGWYETDYKHRR